MTDSSKSKGLTPEEREQLKDVFDRLARGEGPQELTGSLGERVRAMLEELKRRHPPSGKPVELSPETERWLDEWIDAQEKKLH